MKRGRAIVIGLLVLGTLGYCYGASSSYSWNQKMTLEVEVDGQLYTGSSVVTVSVRDSDPLTKGLGFSSQFGARGEAAFVELPNQRYLFALLGGGPPDSGPKTNAINIFKHELPEGDERFAVLAKSRWKKEIPRSHYPLLVTFTDITDPSTVKVIAPNNLMTTFGSGVLLRRIMLEITEEPVTEGKVEGVLGWFLKVDSLTPREKQPRLAKDQTPEQKIGLLDFMDWKTYGDKKNNT